MALYFWKFCVGWTVNLCCLSAVQSTSTLHDELYYRYNTLESAHRSVANVDFDFINEDVRHLRHRRSLEDSKTYVSLSRSTLNSSLQNSPSSNVASAASSSNKASLSSTNDRNSNVHADTATVPAKEIDSGDLPPSELNQLHLFKKTLRLGTPNVPVYDPSRVVTSSNSSISKNISNSSTYVPPNTGQIVSATLEENSKTDSTLGIIDNISKDKDSEVAINQFPVEITNATLKEENITNQIRDNHIYYNSTFLVDEKIGQQYWVELSNNNDAKVHEMLSQSHRRAATVQLSFDFPFYGHLVTNITIATGGFLFTGDHIHSWLAATQFIAPLMANFDNRISDDSFVKYLDNGTAFIVLWENVILRDSPDFGNFTFEAILHKNGDIVFIYKNIPVAVENIKDDQHPVKIGLSDAYIIDRTIFFVKRKTIYEYHRVNFMKGDIKNWTVIYLNALPTCHDMKDCDTCVNANTNLECKWCPAVERCSTGLDRARQEWLLHECDKAHVTHCNESPPPPYAHKAAEDSIITTKLNGAHIENKKAVVGTSGVLSLLLVVTSLAAVAFILLYAYRNPHSTPGQLLIRYRPSQWRFRRGEARYTAATIHM